MRPKLPIPPSSRALPFYVWSRAVDAGALDELQRYAEARRGWEAMVREYANRLAVATLIHGTVAYRIDGSGEMEIIPPDRLYLPIPDKP